MSPVMVINMVWMVKVEVVERDWWILTVESKVFTSPFPSWCRLLYSESVLPRDAVEGFELPFRFVKRA